MKTKIKVHTFVTRSSLKPLSFTRKVMRPWKEAGAMGTFNMYEWSLKVSIKQGRSVGTSSSGAVHFNSGISNVTSGSLNKRRASW